MKCKSSFTSVITIANLTISSGERNKFVLDYRPHPKNGERYYFQFVYQSTPGSTPSPFHNTSTGDITLLGGECTHLHPIILPLVPDRYQGCYPDQDRIGYPPPIQERMGHTPSGTGQDGTSPIRDSTGWGTPSPPFLRQVMLGPPTGGLSCYLKRFRISCTFSFDFMRTVWWCLSCSIDYVWMFAGLQLTALFALASTQVYWGGFR